MTPWTPRTDGPPIPEGWRAEYTPTIMDGPVIRYSPARCHGGPEVNASRNGVGLSDWWAPVALGVLRALLDRAEWDHKRLARGEEP